MSNNTVKPTIKERKTVRSNISTQFKTKGTDKFNALELDALEYVLGNIETHNNSFETVSFDVKDFFEETGRKTNTYENVKNALRHLRKSEIIIDNVTYTSWFSSVNIDPGKSFFYVGIDPAIKKHLIGLSVKFVQYQSNVVFRLNSSYSKKFYPFLKSLFFKSKIQKYNLRISHLREILDINENEYTQYANLKQRVITAIQNEFNQKSDITFEFTEKKENRKVEILQLTITYRDLTGDEFEKSSNPDNPVVDFMQKKYGFNEKSIMKILKIIPKDKTPSELNSDLKEAQKYITKLKLEGKKFNTEAIVTKAIKNSWGDINEKPKTKPLPEPEKQPEVENIIDEVVCDETEPTEIIPEPILPEPIKVKQKTTKTEPEKIKPYDVEYLEKIQFLLETEYLSRTGKTLDKNNNVTDVEIDKDTQTIYFVCKNNTIKEFIINNLDFKFKDVANKKLSTFYNFCEITFRTLTFDIEIIIKGKK